MTDTEPGGLLDFHFPLRFGSNVFDNSTGNKVALGEIRTAATEMATGTVC